MKITNTELRRKTAGCRLEINQLAAACAAMREALDYCRDYVQHRPYGTLFKLFFVEQALSTDAGKSLLEKYQYHLTDNQRLKGELERVCDRLQAVEKQLPLTIAFLKWLDRKGGLGMDVHNMLRDHIDHLKALQPAKEQK